MLTPIGDRVVVKQDEAETVTPGGIMLPDGAKERPRVGKVLSVGPGKLVDGKRVPMEVKDGDRVVFNRYAAQEVEVGEERYLVVSQEEVLAIME